MDTAVSIIIVNYNGAHYLKECLFSLKSLDYPGDKFEVIVFDNGSGDDSVKVVKKLYPSARIIEHPENIGFAAPHRIAAETAKGDVLAFLNNDMKVDKKWLKEGVSLLDPSQGIVCSSSKIMTWDGRHIDFNGGSLQYFGYADQLRDSTMKKGENVLFPCGGAMFIMKDVFLESGGFDDSYFAIFEDVDLGWRLWITGYRVVIATDSITYHKGQSTLDGKDEVKKRFLMHRNALMTIIKNYSDENLKKILPLALVLAVKRALLFQGVDKRDFYFWEEQESKAACPDNYKEGCLHLAAMDDVFSAFESIMQKRQVVQQKRKRDDREIFPLFNDPFRNLMGYSEYLWDEVLLFSHFSLDELFNCKKDYNNRVKEGMYHARGTLKKLKEDIERVSVEKGVYIEPKNNIRQLVNKFYRNLRQNGFSTTIKKTGGYLQKKFR